MPRKFQVIHSEQLFSNFTSSALSVRHCIPTRRERPRFGRDSDRLDVKGRLSLFPPTMKFELAETGQARRVFSIQSGVHGNGRGFPGPIREFSRMQNPPEVNPMSKYGANTERTAPGGQEIAGIHLAGPPRNRSALKPKPELRYECFAKRSDAPILVCLAASFCRAVP